MELNDPITLDDKKRLYAFFFESEEGELFRKLLKDMQEERLDVAQSAYRHVTQPNEQISANVNQAGGIKAVIDFIDSINNEVKENKKQSEKEL